MKKLILIGLVGSFLMADSIYYYNHGKKVFLKESYLRSSIFNYQKEDGESIKVNNRVIAKLKESPEKVLGNKYSYEKLYGNVYEISTGTPQEAIDLANYLFEKGYADFAQPDISKKRILR